MADLKSIVPRLVPGCDIRKLPLGPSEGFVLSRVDGHTSAADIAAMTGLGAAVLDILVKLADLGAITTVATGAPRTAPSPPPAAAPTPPPPKASSDPPADTPFGGPEGSGRMRAAAPVGQLKPRGAQRYTESELDEPAEMDVEVKKRVLELFYELPHANHYEVLGVPRDAEKKAIKSAYYKLAAEFHPDKYFRKNVGSFKQKLESIFKRITEAEETLSRKEPRAQYDQSLSEAPVRVQRIIFDSVPTAPPRPVPPHLANAPIPPPAHPPTPVPEAPVTARSVSVEAAAPISAAPVDFDVDISSVPVEIPPAPVVEEVSRPSVIPAVLTDAQRAQIEARKRALASRLSSGKFQARPASSPAPSSADPAQALRRLQAEKAAEGVAAQAKRHVDAAEAAAARGDAVAAANAYRLAAAVAPTAELEAQVARWSSAANAQLSKKYEEEGERYMKDARYEEGARSLLRAANGAPDDARLQDRAARAIVSAGGDLKVAAELARRAVEKRPTDVSYRLTLAEIYIGAGMRANAKREAEAAAKLDPKDAKVRALLDRLR